eukprot:1178331-Prorocentrum_minimum.AAC.1
MSLKYCSLIHHSNKVIRTDERRRAEVQLKASVKPDKGSRLAGGVEVGDPQGVDAVTQAQVASSLATIRAAVNSILQTVERGETSNPAVSPTAPIRNVSRFRRTSSSNSRSRNGRDPTVR